jgi:predicted RNA-binding protein with PUA-like domain
MANRYWLLKSDPETFGWKHLDKAPKGRTTWDGVRNYQARNTLRDDVAKGDGVLFYHSGDEKAVVGTCTVTRAGFPDPTDAAWTAIEIERGIRFARPLELSELRTVPSLAGMVLLTKGSRLSVQPVTEREWKAIVALGDPAPAGGTRRRG